MAKDTCSTDGCTKPQSARSYCANCYARLYASGELVVLRPQQQRMGPLLEAAAAGRAADDCWLWPGKLCPQGYPVCGTKRPHTVAWERANGREVPKGYEVDHRCHSESTSCPGGLPCPHRRCVNPSHLRLLTHAENQALRINTRAVRRALYPCGNGHPRHEPFGYERADGSWVCRPCRRAERARARARRRAAKGA